MIWDKLTTADADLKKPSSIFFPPPKVHIYTLWVIDGWPGPFFVIMSICLLEPWDHNLFFLCKCIWCRLYSNMEYFWLSILFRIFFRKCWDFALRPTVIFCNVSVLWCGPIAMNADERSWAYDQSWDHHVGKHEALTVYRGRRWKNLGNAHFNVVTCKLVGMLLNYSLPFFWLQIYKKTVTIFATGKQCTGYCLICKIEGV